MSVALGLQQDQRFLRALLLMRFIPSPPTVDTSRQLADLHTRHIPLKFPSERRCLHLITSNLEELEKEGYTKLSFLSGCYK